MNHVNKQVKGTTRFVSKNVDKLSYYEFAVEFFGEWDDEEHCKTCFLRSLDIIKGDKRDKIKGEKVTTYLENIDEKLDDTKVKRLFQELEMQREAENRAMVEKQYTDRVASNLFKSMVQVTLNRKKTTRFSNIFRATTNT